MTTFQHALSPDSEVGFQDGFQVSFQVNSHV